MRKRNDKLSIAECRSILEKDGSTYSDNEILDIIEYLYRLAEMEHDVFLKLNKPENKQLKQAA
jgi:hypothetical protein